MVAGSNTCVTEKPWDYFEFDIQKLYFGFVMKMSHPLRADFLPNIN